MRKSHRKPATAPSSRAPAAPTTPSFEVAMLQYQLAESTREVERLRGLAFIPPTQLRIRETWHERASRLESQLAQLAPGAQKNIGITWLMDTHDCDDCGSSWEEGAIVTLNGETIIDMTPSAYCFDGRGYRPATVYGAILRHLGYAVTEAAAADDTSE